jgi:hypothetical protein
MVCLSLSGYVAAFSSAAKVDPVDPVDRYVPIMQKQLPAMVFPGTTYPWLIGQHACSNNAVFLQVSYRLSAVLSPRPSPL